MFHFVFDSKGAQLIQEAMDMDEALDGETIAVADDYSVGPIQDLFSEEGILRRKNWWEEIYSGAGADVSPRENDADTIDRILQSMREEEFDEIWIWVAPNARDVSGYFWLITQLKEFSGRVQVLHLNNLPFISDKGAVFYPNALSEIPVREFVKARKLARPVTPAEFETDPDEWDKLAADNKNLRLLEGGKKIVQRDDDHYDHAMMPFLQPGFQKISRAVQQFLSKSPQRVNEMFLYWRLKQLVSSGIAEQQGETIRLSVKANQSVTEPSES